MTKIYYDLILRGLRTTEDVPLHWRADVQAMLDANDA